MKCFALKPRPINGLAKPNGVKILRADRTDLEFSSTEANDENKPFDGAGWRISKTTPSLSDVLLGFLLFRGGSRPAFDCFGTDQIRRSQISIAPFVDVDNELRAREESAGADTLAAGVPADLARE